MNLKKLKKLIILFSILTFSTSCLIKASDIMSNSSFYTDLDNIELENNNELEDHEDLFFPEMDNIKWDTKRRVFLSNGAILGEYFYVDNLIDMNVFLTSITLSFNPLCEENYIIDYSLHTVEYQIYENIYDYIKFVVLDSDKTISLKICTNGQLSDYIKFTYQIDQDYVTLKKSDSNETFTYFAKNGKINIIESTTENNFNIPEIVLKRMYFLIKTDLNDVQNDIFANFVSPSEEELEYVAKDKL